ncbi:MAG: hypothetical protein WB579_05290 [Bryobacteraceae bacterium]
MRGLLLATAAVFAGALASAAQGRIDLDELRPANPPQGRQPSRLRAAARTQ